MSKEAMKLALDALELANGMLERADCSTGYCCCGSLVDGHTIGDGHSPVDEGEYFQSKAIRKSQESIKALEEALAKQEQELALQKLHDENESLGLYKDAYGEEHKESVRLQCVVCNTVYADGVPPQVAKQEQGEPDEEVLGFNGWGFPIQHPFKQKHDDPVVYSKEQMKIYAEANYDAGYTTGYMDASVKAHDKKTTPVVWVHSDELDELSHCNGMSVWAENAQVHTEDSITNQLLPNGYLPLYTTPQQRKPLWIDPNDKTQAQFLPHIGEPVLFCHGGKTYYGRHTGGSFQYGAGVTKRDFNTWECRWMYLPAAHGIKE